MTLRWSEVDDLLRRDRSPDQLGGCLRAGLVLFGVAVFVVGLAVAHALGISG